MSADEPTGAQGAATPARSWTRRRAIWLGVAAGLFGLLLGVTLEPAAAAGRWLHRHHWGGHGDHGRHAVQWLLDEVEADDEQRAQVEAVYEELRGRLQDLREARHAQHAALTEALTADTVDPEALEAIRADTLRLAERASVDLTEAVVEVARVLTPDQRAALAAFHERHRGRHHR